MGIEKEILKFLGEQPHSRDIPLIWILPANRLNKLTRRSFRMIHLDFEMSFLVNSFPSVWFFNVILCLWDTQIWWLAVQDREHFRNKLDQARYADEIHELGESCVFSVGLRPTLYSTSRHIVSGTTGWRRSGRRTVNWRGHHIRTRERKGSSPIWTRIAGVTVSYMLEGRREQCNSIFTSFPHKQVSSALKT